MFRLTRPETAFGTGARQTARRHSWSSRTTGHPEGQERRSFSRFIPAISVIAVLSLAAGPVDDPSNEASHPTAASAPPVGMAAASSTALRSAQPELAAQLSVAQQEMVEWAKGLFEEAGLPLPEVVVSFHNNTEACHGFKGRWERADGIADRVMVCNMHDNPQLQDERRRRTLVHEFAHAWAASALDEDSRTRFMELRGLTSWSDASQPWVERGTEQAAVVVTWGVIDMKLYLWGFPNRTCPAMAAAYYLLTGTEPHKGLEENCG